MAETGKQFETMKMTPSLKPLARGLLLLALLATPALAQEEPNGYPITNVNLRAGPGTEYPVLVTVPTDAPVTILGCLEDYTWCDTIFEDQRGWMRSIYLAGYYDGEYYLLSDYAPDLGYQTVTFDVAAYWDAYYQDEPFYND
ncbi:MAG: SH3 domain-containing protein, partial [Methyloceanibacter sp.]|uniref:SH3 domain-containing protein n=1 Tax=Methyloceanibacter sp. TaxID=1965321 RepID=UPI003EE33613